MRLTVNNKNLIILFYLCVMLAAPVYSGNIISDVINDFGSAGSAVISEPLKTTAILGAFTAAEAVIMNNDSTWLDNIQSNKNDLNDRIAERATQLGDGIFVFAANSLLFLGGEKEQNTAVKVMETVAVAGIINYILKVGTGRQRPSSSDDPGQYSPFSFTHKSMPSGHTAVAFAWASVIGDSYGIGYITYPLAALCGLERIYSNDHWPSDVLAGAFVGIVVAKSIMGQNEDAGFSINSKHDATKICLTLNY